MPVRFQGDSEYKRQYQWNGLKESHDNAEIRTLAGLSSEQLALTQEPPIQRRKKPIHYEATSTTAYDESADKKDEYILLGDQGKFASSTKYRVKNKNGVIDSGSRSPPPAPRRPKHPHKAKSPSRQHKDVTPNGEIRPAISENKRIEAPVNKPAPAKHHKSKELQSAVSKAEPKKSVKIDTRDKNVDKMNEFVQTDMDKNFTHSGQEATADYAMRYRAGIAPARPKGPKRLSEYASRFQWYDPVKSSPLLAAEQMVYQSTNPLVAGKTQGMPKFTEYKAQFKPWQVLASVPEIPTGRAEEQEESPSKKAKIARSKSMESLSVAQLPPAGVHRQVPADNKRLVRESVNPLRPFFPSGKFKQYKSEYSTNYKPPLDFQYVEGAWKGADPPHIKPKQGPDSKEELRESAPPVGATPSTSASSWYSEVMELRKRADEYKKRARGTHFSREHLAQLYAKNAQMWDTVSNSSTLSALSLESAAHKPKNEHPEPVVVHPGPANDITPQQQNKPPTSKDERPIISQARKAWEDEKESVSSLSSAPSSRKSTYTASEMSSVRSSPSQGSTVRGVDTDDEGRVPTPKLRYTTATMRHHLDRTTPAVGGAILTSPEKLSPRDSVSSDSRVGKPASHQLASQMRQTSGNKVCCTCGADEATPTSSEYESHDQPSQDYSKSHGQEGPIRKESSKENLPPKSAAKRQSGKTNKGRKLPKSSLQVQKSASEPIQTYGMPTRDTHVLVDEEASIDRPLSTKYTRSPPDNRLARKLDFLGRHPELSLPSTVLEDMGPTYNVNKPDDDVMSVSARSVASSCSMASEVLERARNRRDEFWGLPRK